MSWRTLRKARESDIEFLATLRTAPLPVLSTMLRNHMHKSAPEWRRVAIKRAIARRAKS